MLLTNTNGTWIAWNFFGSAISLNVLYIYIYIYTRGVPEFRGFSPYLISLLAKVNEIYILY